jgi:hypothetical protein
VKQLDTLITEVRLRAPGVPDPTASLMLRRAAEEFCRATWCWQEEVEDLDLDEGVVTLDPPSGARIVGVASIRHFGRLLSPVGERVAARSRRTVSGAWQPWAYYLPRPDAIVFVPNAPGDDEVDLLDAVTVTAALAPSESATGLPDFLGSEYSETLVAGALSRLLVLPGAAFANPDGAAAAQQVFNRGIADARRQRYAGYNTHAVQVAQHPLAWGRK